MRQLCLVLSIIAGGALAEPVRCAGTGLAVVAPDPVLGASICEMAGRLAAPLSRCGAAIPDGIAVEITSDLPEHCAGLYDCAGRRIKLRPPAEAHAGLPDADPLHVLGEASYFESLLAHELTHAAFFAVPRDCGTCRATTEYAAYVMQILSLTPADRDGVLSGFDPDRRVGSDSINPMILALSPSVFMERAWTHAVRRGDPCEAVAAVLEGRLAFQDRHF